jgi:hypothetical protein
VPIAGLGLHIIIAICFAVHAMRTGQDRYWLMILFMFPLLGSLVYAIAIWWPDARRSYAGQQIVKGVRNALDPDRELRAAQDAFDLSASADNRLRLAEALLAKNRATEAAVQFRAAMSAVHRDDPVIHVRLAHALLEAGDAAAAREELDALRRAHPNIRSPEGHLIYARALAALDDRDRAREEFDSLIGYYAGFEPRARYAQALQRWGETAAARELAQTSMKQAARLPKYSRRMNHEWIKSLERIARGEAEAAR